jgi:hypothetical protein
MAKSRPSLKFAVGSSLRQSGPAEVSKQFVFRSHSDVRPHNTGRLAQASIEAFSMLAYVWRRARDPDTSAASFDIRPLKRHDEIGPPGAISEAVKFRN